MSVNVRARQWLGDVALDTSGNMNSLFEIATENGISITDDLIVGNNLLNDIDSTILTDKTILKYFADNMVIPATGFTEEDIAAQVGGIGYMGIQIDFKVS